MDKQFLKECLQKGLSTRDIEKLPNVNIKYNMQHYLGDEYVIDAPDIPYDYEVFKSKYGTREENGKKFVNDNI